MLYNLTFLLLSNAFLYTIHSLLTIHVHFLVIKLTFVFYATLLAEQYGGASEYFYSQFELHARSQKMNQIVLLQVSYHITFINYK